jgi:hypothetical protein
LSRRVAYALLLCLLASCKQSNPAFRGASDLAAPADLAMRLPDGSTPLHDLSVVPSGDLSKPPVVDLAASDLSTPTILCGDMLCAGCCVSGVCHDVGDVCATGTVCTAGGTCSACGGASQPCCSLNFCNGALVCSDGTCNSCGTPGGACCPGNTCTGGGCCVSSVCVRSGKQCSDKQICLDTVCTACGGNGLACCADNSCTAASACCNTANRTCVSNGGSCGAAGSCTAGSCNGLGGVSQTCFQTPTQTQNLCSASGTVCDDASGPGTDGECQTCGTDGLPCCGVSTCASGGCCVSGVCHATGTSCGTAGGNCSSGTCNGGTCGGLGQACCAGTLCTAPDTRCITPVGGSTASCVPCGGKNQRCCVDPATAQNIFCEPPFTCTVVVVAGQNIGFCR